jgi:hypothetical protein
VRGFLVKHEARTIMEMQWPAQIENGELLKAAERAGFEVLLTSDQNIKHQQNLTGNKLALIVLGSNIWPVVRNHAALIEAALEKAAPRSYQFIEVLLPKKPQKRPSKK